MKGLDDIMNQDEIVKLLMELKEKAVRTEERIIRMEEKIDNINTYKEKTDEAHILSRDNEKRLNKIEDAQKWLFRAVVGGGIAVLFDIIVKFKF